MISEVEVPITGGELVGTRWKSRRIRSQVHAISYKGRIELGRPAGMALLSQYEGHTRLCPDSLRRLMPIGLHIPAYLQLPNPETLQAPSPPSVQPTCSPPGLTRRSPTRPDPYLEIRPPFAAPCPPAPPNVAGLRCSRIRLRVAAGYRRPVSPPRLWRLRPLPHCR